MKTNQVINSSKNTCVVERGY